MYQFDTFCDTFERYVVRSDTRALHGRSQARNAHGGDVKAESQYGSGTTIRVRLPVGDE